MIFLSFISIATLMCVNQLKESHRYLIESHIFLKKIDNGIYDNLTTNDITQQEMISKIRLSLLRIEFEPDNPRHEIEIKWLISKIKEKECVKFNEHTNTISKIINNFLIMLPYLIIFNVLIINIAFHKRCEDVKPGV